MRRIGGVLDGGVLPGSSCHMHGITVRGLCWLVAFFISEDQRVFTARFTWRAVNLRLWPSRDLPNQKLTLTYTHILGWICVISIKQTHTHTYTYTHFLSLSHALMWTLWMQGECWFKHPNATPSSAPGRVACWPPGHGPIPPTPPPAPPAPSADIETHGPYQHGTGFPAVNGATNLELFDANIPISIAPIITGPQYPNVFASEFGCVTMSSFESMTPLLAEKHWGLHAGMPGDNCVSVFQERQWAARLREGAIGRG